MRLRFIRIIIFTSHLLVISQITSFSSFQCVSGMNEHFDFYRTPIKALKKCFKFLLYDDGDGWWCFTFIKMSRVTILTFAQTLPFRIVIEFKDIYLRKIYLQRMFNLRYKNWIRHGIAQFPWGTICCKIKEAGAVKDLIPYSTDAQNIISWMSR